MFDNSKGLRIQTEHSLLLFDPQQFHNSEITNFEMSELGEQI